MYVYLHTNLKMKKMKKLYSLSLLLTCVLSFAQATDPFLGTGSLNANGWTTHSGTAGQQTIVTGGSLSYSTMATSGNRTQIIAGNSEDVNLASQADLTGVAYYSALINVLNTNLLAPNTDTSGSYFLCTGVTAGTSVTGFNGRIYIRAGATADTFNLGILNGPGGTATPTIYTTDLPVNTVTFVVVKFDFTSNTASLFINPSLDGVEGTPAVTNATGTSAAPAQIRSVVIIQTGTTSNTTGNIEIDNVRIGGTWAYVTSSTLGINKNSIEGLKMYPNPVSNGTLYITTDANAEKNIAIYDLLGKQVLTTTTTNSQVNVNNLSAGVYMVKITEEGKTATRKLVIN